MSTVSIVGGVPSGSGSSIVAPPGGRGGNGAVDVEQAGAPIVEAATKLNFASGAVITDGGGGIADIAITGGENLVFNVKDYGATGNGTTNDSNAIREAIAAASADGGGIVYFPNGTYVVTEEGISGACLIIPSNTTLYGQSKEGAVIKMGGNQDAFVRPILVGVTDGSAVIADVRIANLTIDGNKSGQITDEEHRAGIFLWNSLRTLIVDVIIRNNTGDGVDFHLSTSTVVERCYIHDNDRGGLGVEGGPNTYMAIRDCYLENNIAQFSIESEALNSWIWIEDTYCGPPATGGEVSVGISLITSDIFLTRVQIIGGLNISSVARATFDSCYIESGNVPASDPPPVRILPSVSDVRFVNCTIHQTADLPNNPFVMFIEGTAIVGPQPTNIIIEGCHLISDAIGTNNTNLAASGIACYNTANVYVRNNIIENTMEGNSEIAVLSFGSDTIQAAPTQGDFFLNGNRIINWSKAFDTGVNSSLLSIGALVINGNFLDSCTVGYNFEIPIGGAATTVPGQLEMSGNDSTSVGEEWQSYPNCPILIGGTRANGAVYSCSGSPEGAIAAPVGSMALQRDGVTSIVGWIKTSGAGNTGWQSINVT